MFVQERTTPDGAGGLGLGLGLVEAARRAARRHACTRRATGPGTGATFEVRLPLADSATLAQVAAARAPRPAPQTGRCARSSSTTPPICASSSPICCGMKGHEVTVVEDGPTAVAADPRASGPTSR